MVTSLDCLFRIVSWAVKIRSFSERHKLQHDGFPLSAFALLIIRHLMSYVVLLSFSGLGGYQLDLHNSERERKGCGDVVLLNVWCGFAEIFIFCCGIAVLLNQAVCGI